MDAVGELVNQRPLFALETPYDYSRAVKINDFIYMSPGTSNAYMVVTDTGRVIINTGMGWETIQHKKLFDGICPGPTSHIITTQGHVDHVGGVSQFRETDTQYIAQEDSQACQQDDKRIKNIRISQAGIWFSRTFSRAAKVASTNPEVFVQDEPIADIQFKDHYSLETGGRKFELISVPGGETLDSILVWLPEHRILFSGNLFGPLFPHFPNINTLRGDKYRFIEPYLDALQGVRSLEPELLITGHFQPVAGKQLILCCLDRLKAAVEYVHNETLKGINAGKDIWRLMRDIHLPDELYVGQSYGQVHWAVRTIWESYMGWFKARSTSELYATQPEDIYADLVELAGIEAVLSLSREKLQTGDPESALLLAEAALASDGNHSLALQLSIDIHQTLIDRQQHDNFWELGWLRHQISQLNEKKEKKEK